MKTLLCGAIAALCLSSNAVLAQHAIGHVGVARGYGGWHGGWHGGYGYGWRGGWGWRGGGYWGPWGWGGLGLGLYFASLPYYYTTYRWGGVPYYYADNTYYRWNAGVGQYETVAPPADAAAAAAAPSAAGQSAVLIAYPKNGQSEDQQGKDKFECHRWAVSQSGFDPTQAGGGAAGGSRSDYTRAQAACLEGRGYSVK